MLVTVCSSKQEDYYSACRLDDQIITVFTISVIHNVEERLGQ